jgi:hypothetical protein
MQTTVRRQLDSTVTEEPLVKFDSTVSKPSGRTEITATSRGKGKPRPTSSMEISVGHIVAMAGAALIAFLGWAGYVLVGLNREVGEIRSKIDHVDHLEQRVDDLEKQLEAETKDRLTASPPATRSPVRR